MSCNHKDSHVFKKSCYKYTFEIQYSFKLLKYCLFVGIEDDFFMSGLLFLAWGSIVFELLISLFKKTDKTIISQSISLTIKSIQIISI